jgi:predicted enzyme related to lactoylglutathione lyase
VTRWIAASWSRSTSRRWPASRTSRRRTSAGCSAARSARPRTGTCSDAASSGRCSSGLTTDDCQKTYETLRDRGVELTQEPTQQPYGIDCGARDPFGNHFRIVQLAFEP